MNASAPADRCRTDPPCGGALVNLLMPEGGADAMAYASRLPSIPIPNAICDLECWRSALPLDRFMGRRDYQSVLDSMRLANGHLFPIPVTLPVDPGLTSIWARRSLRDAKNNVLALMVIEEIYPWDPGEMATRCSAAMTRHPMVAEMSRYGPVNISGRLRALQLPPHYDFKYASTPAETRSGSRHEPSQRRRLQTRNPLHRVRGATKRGARTGRRCSCTRRRADQAGRRGSHTRAPTAPHRELLRPGSRWLALLPLAMRLAGRARRCGTC